MKRAAKPRMGRPPLSKGEAKEAVLSVRLSTEERMAIEQAAERAGRSPSEWARDALVRAAADSPRI